MFEWKNESILIFTSPYVDITLSSPSKSDKSLAEEKQLAFTGHKTEHSGQAGPKRTELWILPSTVLISFESFA